MNQPLGGYSTFLPARGAQLAVNGEAATAKVFAQERSGRPSSSLLPGVVELGRSRRR
jgi:hypothetical protein